LRHQVAATESESFRFGLHIDIEVIAFDSSTAVFTAEFSHAFNTDLGTKRKSRRTSKRPFFSYL